LLGAAAEAGLQGACLLGEMPHIFAQIPFPKASHAILDVFATLAGIDLDLTELEDQARSVEKQLGDILARVEEQYGKGMVDIEEAEDDDGEPEDEATVTEPPRRQPIARKRIEELFDAAKKDRSKAFELKRELDNLGLFAEYEDRFLDLFKKHDA
jgi:hypothetical protein